MAVPIGSYPRMLTGVGPNGGQVPLVYPAGDPKQYMFVIHNSATDEAAYAGNGIAVSNVAGPTSTHGNGWSSGNWRK